MSRLNNESYINDLTIAADWARKFSEVFEDDVRDKLETLAYCAYCFIENHEGGVHEKINY